MSIDICGMRAWRTLGVDRGLRRLPWQGVAHTSCSSLAPFGRHLRMCAARTSSGSTWSDPAWDKELAARSKVPASFRDDAGLYSTRLTASLARLDELVDWERRTRTVGENRVMRVNSSPCAAILELLGNPQKKLQTVHVTGSKGKGSCVSILSAALAEQGYKTGTFCSPHVSRVNERVLVDLCEVEDDLLAETLDEVLDLRSKHKLHDSTWFDVLAATGLTILQRIGAEWALVEVGLGGSLDSTNVLDSEFCVITNIYLEHQAIIGPGREDIAREKAGIIRRPGCSVVTGIDPEDIEVRHPIESQVSRVGAQSPVFVRERFPAAPFSELNAQIAACVLDEMGERGVVSKRSGSVLHGGMIGAETRAKAAAALKGRMEPFVVDGVDVVVDGAHVAESVAAVMEEVARKFGPAPQVLLIATGSDKDVDKIASMATSTSAPLRAVVTTRIAESPRYTPADEMRAAFCRADAHVPVTAHDSPQYGLRIAVGKARELGGYVLIVGSLHLAGAVRKLMSRQDE